MSAIAPVASSSFVPQERQQPPGRRRPGGPHRPARADPLLDLADRRPWGRPRQAAGVAAGTNYRERDLELALLAGVQVGSIAAGMSFVGAWAERKRMTRVARAAADLAVKLTAAGTPDDEAATRLLDLRGADRVALQQAARRAAGSPDNGRALGLLGRVAVLRALL